MLKATIPNEAMCYVSQQPSLQSRNSMKCMEKQTQLKWNFNHITEVFSFLLVELNDITSMEGDVAISKKITYVFTLLLCNSTSIKIQHQKYKMNIYKVIHYSTICKRKSL